MNLSPKLYLSRWQQWWQGLSTKEKSAPLLSVLGVMSVFWFFGTLTKDHLGTGLGVLLLAYAGPKPRQFLLFLLPLVLTAIVYDSQRIYADAIRGQIHVKEPYFFDKTFFGIHTAQGILTPNEWWELHTHPVLDAITGFFYIFFVPIFIVFAFYFQMVKKFPAAPQMMWAFFWVNVIGYTTYYWYPAAPPWYVKDHGLGPADLSVRASAAGAVRFDALFGTNFFGEWYGRSADVFGAIPSLHVAYPLLAVFYAFKFKCCRFLALFYCFWVAFSAVYLNHHYVLDILWGYGYAILIFVGFELYYRRKDKLETDAEVSKPIVQSQEPSY